MIIIIIKKAKIDDALVYLQWKQRKLKDCWQDLKKIKCWFWLIASRKIERSVQVRGDNLINLKLYLFLIKMARWCCNAEPKTTKKKINREKDVEIKETSKVWRCRW